MFVLPTDPAFKLQASPRLHPTCSLLSTQSIQHALLALSTTLAPLGLSLLSSLNLSTTPPARYDTKVGMYYCLTFMCYSAPMNFTQLRLQLSSCVLTTALIFPSGNISSSCEK
ncbi:hypothetical protein K503DRAFT_774245 [Rhizopogon vinicolor AM-OR11-026]|uniref:Uncharacterized protein n=1 Tax=Rhizopogon vinicolor AM-OR11-026 TaxID=1314800 RepID=A0A1B7MQ47_9AGAM|nr:hypothetical protein K503DRAFT_774245 [Rhizopogon vinicolor AM-OR11-026]